MNPHTLSSRYQPDIDNELRSIVGDSSLPLYHMMRYHLGWVDAEGQARLTSGGKLLRPSMCLLANEAVGGEWKKVIPAAASLELIHNFTLIHDDIEDGDHERRGVPTVWSVWGLPQGLNTGDAMHIIARLALLRLEETGISADKVLKAAGLLDETCLRLCEGQYMDISFESLIEVDIDDYLQMIGGKTAALFACSFGIGALLGTDNKDTIGHLTDFGINLGMAFQIQDDILGIWGNDSKTGKSTSNDILKKKKTLPVIYGIQKSQGKQKEILLSIYSLDEIHENHVPQVLQILKAANARQHAQSVARRYREQALSSLEKAEITPSAKDDLTALTDFMIKREY